MKKKSAGKPAPPSERIAVEDANAVLSQPAAKPTDTDAGTPRDTERTCEHEIDSGADFQAGTGMTARIAERTGGFSRINARGAVKDFAAQGVNSDVPNAERCGIKGTDIHAPMARTSERTRRNVTFTRTV